jgi:hypothetical protein
MVMKIEYIFTDEEYKDIELKDGVERDEKSLKEEKSKIISFSFAGDEDEAARVLSDIFNKIGDDMPCPVLLLNEASQYYNRKLFPLISDFEVKLRKLLYLVSFLDSNSFEIIISNLERMNFGELFNMLFIDNNFCKIVNKKVKDIGSQFTESEINDLIENLQGNTLWDKLISEAVTFTLRENYNMVRDFRNDVMHAHNIDYEQYHEIEKMYTIINRELNDALNTIENTLENKDDAIYHAGFNETMRTFINEEHYYVHLINEIEAMLHIDSTKTPEEIETIKLNYEVLEDALRRLRAFKDQVVDAQEKTREIDEERCKELA